jgi:hypothetical protein
MSRIIIAAAAACALVASATTAAAKIAQSDVPDTMLSLLTALKASSGAPPSKASPSPDPNASAGEDWSGVPVGYGQSQVVAPGDPVIPKTSTTNADHVLTWCDSSVAGIGCPLGISSAYAYVPITAFARSSTVEALGGEVAGLGADVARLQAAIGDPLTRRLFRGVALASALDFQSPAAGKSNRIGGAMATTHGQLAGALTFTHRQGRLDVSFGGAFTSTDILAKAAVGLSW